MISSDDSGQFLVLSVMADGQPYNYPLPPLPCSLPGTWSAAPVTASRGRAGSSTRAALQSTL